MMAPLARSVESLVLLFTVAAARAEGAASPSSCGFSLAMPTLAPSCTPRHQLCPRRHPRECQSAGAGQRESAGR
jgi:hypothetical protein